jgi:hypothetical protein
MFKEISDNLVKNVQFGYLEQARKERDGHGFSSLFHSFPYHIPLACLIVWSVRAIVNSFERKIVFDV